MSTPSKEEALNSKNPKDRKEAIENLRWDEIPALTPKLLDMLSTENDKDVLLAIPFALSANPDPSVLNTITGFFSHSSPLVRLAAVQSISPEAAPQVFKELLPLLKDKDGDVRQYAIWKMSNFEKTPDPALLKSVLDDSSFPGDAAILVQYLSPKDAMNYSDRIRSVLNDPSSKALGTIVTIVGNLRLSEFSKDLVRYLTDDSCDSDAIQAMEKLDAREFLNEVRDAAKIKKSPLAVELVEKWSKLKKNEKTKKKPTDPLSSLKKEGFKDLSLKLKTLAKPSLSLNLSVQNDDTIPLGASKLGGKPDISPTVPWPSNSAGPLKFLAQINLIEVTALQKGTFPPSGLLSFFYDPKNYLDGGRDVLKVIFTKGKASKLERRTPPAEAVVNRLSCAVALEKSVSFPSPQSDAYQKQISITAEEQEAYKSLLREMGQTETDEDHRILGYPNIINAGDLGGPDLSMLLQLSSSNMAQLPWASGGRVYILIENEDLNKENFDKAELHFRSA